MANEEQCRRAMKVHNEQLLRLKNVEGLGVREIEPPDDAAGQLCLAVYVKEKVPCDQLAPNDVIPEFVSLTNEDDGTIVQVPTGVFEIGELRLGG